MTHGFNVHPGSSKNVMINASLVAMEINEANSSEKCGNGLIYAYGTEAYNYFKAKTETPVFSLDSNFYYSDIDLTISCDTPGSTIYYTTDKSVPSKTNPNAKIYMATTKAEKVYTDVEYEPDCYIMFGPESRGIPEEILVKHPDTSVRIPMWGETRSLNLSNSVAIILYEALRQNGFEKMTMEGHLRNYNWEE